MTGKTGAPNDILSMGLGADPAFGQGGGCKNNGTQTFAVAIANISDYVMPQNKLDLLQLA